MHAVITLMTYVAAMLGCIANGPVVFRHGRYLLAMFRLRWRKCALVAPATEQGRQRQSGTSERARREALELDVFWNSTEHEEYQPS